MFLWIMSGSIVLPHDERVETTNQLVRQSTPSIPSGISVDHVAAGMSMVVHDNSPPCSAGTNVAHPIAASAVTKVKPRQANSCEDRLWGSEAMAETWQDRMACQSLVSLSTDREVVADIVSRKGKVRDPRTFEDLH